ncbi:MAG: glycosyltransferase family 9 protein [Chlamydiia bacterium]|nr:glycosyltransferase family 9 protein [Chlamydiia bacterium]
MFPLANLKKIAIIRRNGLGDLLCLFPTILYLKEKAKSAEITLFVDHQNSPLLSYLPSVDNIVVFPTSGNKYLHLLRAALKMRWKKYDLALSGKTSPMKLMNVFLFALGAKRRVAYCDESWHSRFINFSLPYHSVHLQNIHQAVRSLQMVAPHLSTIPSRFQPTITVPRCVKQLYQQEIVALFSKTFGSSPMILLSASTNNPCNRLDPKNYAQIVNHAAQGLFIAALVIGLSKDQMRAKAICNELIIPNAIYLPRNFDAFMVALDQCDLFFVGDGGVAHLGASLNKKVVVLYGGVNPKQWTPLGREVDTFFHPHHVEKIEKQQIVHKLRTKIYESYHDRREDMQSQDR